MTRQQVIRAWWLPALAFVLASVAWVWRDGMLVKQQLKLHGVAVEARVTELVEAHPAKSGPCTAATYRFVDPQGDAQTGRVGCRQTAQLGLAPGSGVVVTYLPDDPATHRPGRFDSYALWRELLVTLAVTGTGALLLVLAGLALNRAVFRSRPRSEGNSQ